MAPVNLATGTNVDRYVVEGLLGRGGMAMVYRVRHKTLGSVHALKVLLVQAPSVQARLLQEGRAQSGFRHGNVVAVTDVIDIAGCPAIVLEYVEGPPLDLFLANVRPSLDQIDLLARGILRGLGAAHRQGLVHRDLKPGNVLLAIHSDEIVPKVNDFGLAKVLDAGASDQNTRTGATLGTPAYMAPEQIHDAAHVDARADVWAAGALLYELVTGRRAFDGADTLAVMNAVASGRYTPPSDLVSGVPERMLAAIASALVVDPAARAPSIEALLATWQGEVAAPAAQVVFDADFRSRAESLRSQPEVIASSGETWGQGTRGVTTPLEPSIALPTPQPASSPSTSRPGRPRSWPRLGAAFALGTFVGLPFLVGDLGLIFDDPAQAVAGGGPWMVGALGLSALGIGGIAAVALDEREGRPHALPWLAVPGLLTACGSLGAMFNSYVALRHLATLDAGGRAQAAARGLAEAMSTTVAASAFASSLFALAAVSLAWAVRFDHDFVQKRAVGIAVPGVFLGGLAWYVHPLLSGIPNVGMFEVFPVFAIMAVGLGAVITLAEDVPRPETLRARMLASGIGAFAVAHTARAVDTRHLMRTAHAFADGGRFDGDLAHVEGFVANVGHIQSGPGLFWAAAFLVACLPVFAWRRTGATIPWSVLAATIGTFLVVAPMKLWADHVTGELAMEVLPGEVRAVSRWHLGVELVDASGIVVGVAPPASALRSGDRIISIGERVFDDAPALLHALWDCRCPATTCALGASCLAPHSTLAVTVARPQASGPDAKLDLVVPLVQGATAGAAP